MSSVFVWGASGHAKVVADILKLNHVEIAGFIDTNRSAPGEFLGVPVFNEVPFEKSARFIVAVGDCGHRTRIASAARSIGMIPLTAIHPRSVIAGDVVIGDGSVVAAGAVINPGTTVGENVIINTGATVDHDCVISEGVHISPGVHLAGQVSVGAQTWVGIGSVVRQRISIGAHSVIGAGSVVVADIADNTLAFGVPARPIRKIS